MSSTESASAVYRVAIIGADAGGLCAYEFLTFEHAKMLSVRVMRGDWPAQRSCAAYHMSPDTPLANLWHVGCSEGPRRLWNSGLRVHRVRVRLRRRAA